MYILKCIKIEHIYLNIYIILFYYYYYNFFTIYFFAVKRFLHMRFVMRHRPKASSCLLCPTNP